MLRPSCAGLCVQGIWFRLHGLEFRVSDFLGFQGLWVQGLGLRVLDLFRFSVCMFRDGGSVFRV